MNSKRFDRLGRFGCVVAALTLGGQSAFGGVAAPSAYFSLQGDISAVGDQYDFTFDLSRPVGSAEDLRFLGFGDTVTTNAAGDNIADVNFDSDLHLYDSLSALRGQDDESGPNFDALLTWAPTTTDLPLNPDPLPAGSYRLNIQHYQNNSTGPFAVDLVGPDDALVFTGGTPVNGGTVDSLKFGSNTGGNATYNHSAASGTFTLLGQLVVAQTGNAVLNQSGGTINVGGLTTVRAGGDFNLSGGTFLADGGLFVQGGSFNRTAGNYTPAAGTDISVEDGGLFDWNNAGLTLNTTGLSVLVTGNGSTLQNVDTGSYSLRVQNNVSIDATLGGDIIGEYLVLSRGTVTVDGAGSSLVMNTGTQAPFSHFVGEGTASVSNLTLSHNAAGNLTDTLGTELRVGFDNSTGTVDVLSDADLTLHALDMDETGTSTVTVNGSGSTITQTAGSALTVGSASGTTGTLNVQNGGVFNASHTGALNINATGTLNVNSGGFFNVIPPNAGINVNGAAGGTLNSAGAVNVDTGTLQVIGGRGGDGNISTFFGAAGGAGGSVFVTGSVFTVTGDGVVSVTGGRGGDPGFFANGGGHGGAGGLFEVNGGSVVLNQNALLSAKGGNGGTGGQGAVSGSGGTGGTVRINSGSLTLNSGNITTAGGVPGAVGFAGSSGVHGAPGLIDVAGGSFTMNGGDVFTGTFQRSGAGVFNFNDGKLTVSGGTFNPGTANFTINGPSAAELPTLVMTAGATAPGVTGSLYIGDNNRGRFELRNGATLTTNNDTYVGNQATGHGQVFVDGPGTVWDHTGSYIFLVGENGNGDMTVSNQAQVNAGTYFDVARNGTGSLLITSGGSVSVAAAFIVGEFGAADVTVNGGGSISSQNDLYISAFTGADGTLNVDGPGTSVDVGNILNVSGWDTLSGGAALMNISNGASVNVNNTMYVHGAGTVNFSGGALTADTIDHTTGGAFNFTGGTLVVNTFNGTLDNNGGAVAPGSSPGITQVSGNYNQSAGSLKMELAGGGGVAGIDFDRLEVTGNVALAGALDVSLFGGFTPAIGDSFFIVHYGGTRSGAFDNVLLPGTPGVGLRLEYVPNYVRLVTALAGDLNGDGFVGIADLNIVLGNWNQNVDAGVWLQGDPTGDGFIGIADLNVVLGNWNAGTPPPAEALALAQVPEPGALVVFVPTLLAAIRRRRVG